jgi:FAD dependent oxidoreductase TIGR03364
VNDKRFDLIVVGSGIAGLAHAWMGLRRGLRVALIERDHRCVGASIRNFGFVTVTGQRAGDTWRRARRSRDLWAELAPQAGIPIVHQGLWVVAQRARALDVLAEFVGTEMGERCELHRGQAWGARMPSLKSDGVAGALYSPHELRVESREAIPALARWLQAQGVRFIWGQEVLGIEGSTVHGAQGQWTAERIVVCPGTELNGVARRLLPDHALRLTRLQMLRVRPSAGLRLGAAVMSDLSLVRYHGYADLASSAPLLEQLRAECGPSLDDGTHLIAVQSADGTLVVGDSHHPHATPEPFASEAVDERILGHLYEVVGLDRCEVVERWTGVYPTGHGADALVHAPADHLRLVLVTSGTGASTAFGIAEDVFAGW